MTNKKHFHSYYTSGKASIPWTYKITRFKVVTTHKTIFVKAKSREEARRLAETQGLQVVEIETN